MKPSGTRCYSLFAISSNWYLFAQVLPCYQSLSHLRANLKNLDCFTVYLQLYHISWTYDCWNCKEGNSAWAPSCSAYQTELVVPRCNSSEILQPNMICFRTENRRSVYVVNTWVPLLWEMYMCLCERRLIHLCVTWGECILAHFPVVCCSENDKSQVIFV